MNTIYIYKMSSINDGSPFREIFFMLTPVRVKSYSLALIT
jgi:hypothetical protein